MRIKAKKSLGQNFLIDKNIIEKIASITEISNKEILEIGPGTGNLSVSLLKKKPKKFFAFEKDKDLCSMLSNKFKDQVEIRNIDVLKANMDLISKKKLSK